MVRLRSFFDAANTSRLEESWSSHPQTADTIIRKEWKTMVARCLDQGNNSPHGRRFLGLLRDNVPGPTGFALQANTKTAGGKPDKRANEALESAWKEFSRRGNFEITGQLDRAALERLGIATCATHGEFFVVSVLDPSLNKWGISFQLLDPLMVAADYFEDFGDGRVVRCGVESRSLHGSAD